MKNGLYTFTFNVKGHGLSPVSQLKQYQSLIFTKKIMFIPHNRTIDSNIYYQELSKLNNFLQEKRPKLVNCTGVVFHHDNSCPHTSLVTYQKLVELG